MQDFSKNSTGDWIVNAIMASILIVCAIAGAYAVYQAGRITVAVGEYLLDNAAYAECRKWQDYELVLPEWNPESETGYYITPWQKEQCDTVGVELDAHVLNYQTN